MNAEQAYDRAKELVEGMYALNADAEATEHARRDIADALLAAVAAERERCARIVEDCKGDPDGDHLPLGMWRDEWFIPDADQIAAAIREGKR